MTTPNTTTCPHCDQEPWPHEDLEHKCHRSCDEHCYPKVPPAVEGAPARECIGWCWCCCYDRNWVRRPSRPKLPNNLETGRAGDAQHPLSGGAPVLEDEIAEEVAPEHAGHPAGLDRNVHELGLDEGNMIGRTADLSPQSDVDGEKVNEWLDGHGAGFEERLLHAPIEACGHNTWIYREFDVYGGLCETVVVHASDLADEDGADAEEAVPAAVDDLSVNRKHDHLHAEPTTSPSSAVEGQAYSEHDHALPGDLHG